MAMTPAQYADNMKCLELYDLYQYKAGLESADEDCITEVKRLMDVCGAFSDIPRRQQTQINNIKIKLELIR